jgi:hypothetical protein
MRGVSRERIRAPGVAPNHRQVGPHHRAPARRREPPVGEEQDRQSEQRDGRRPGILQQQRDRAERQAVAQTVSEQHIGRGIRREQLERVTLPERCAHSVRAFRYGGQEERQSGESEGTRMAAVASRPPKTAAADGATRFLDVRRNLLAPHTPVHI